MFPAPGQTKYGRYRPSTCLLVPLPVQSPDGAVCSFGHFSLHDLVILDQQTGGVIISISANTCRVLTNQARPTLIRPQGSFALSLVPWVDSDPG